MFLDWKNQYCENDSTTQSNLQIQCIPYQITNGIFHRTRSKNLKICMQTQKSLNSQRNLEKKNGAGGIRLPDSRLYYKATVIKTVWYQHKTRNIGKWNRIKSSEINQCTFVQLINDKGDNTMQRRKDSLFNKQWWENWTATCKRKELDHSVTSYNK